mgnify:CR=1 FL=1
MSDENETEDAVEPAEVPEGPWSVESKIAPPPLTCPKCDGLLPSALGELSCVLCGARMKIEHEVTRREWEKEKLGCPKCKKLLVVGVGERPTNIRCASCQCDFEVKAKVPKTEVKCPGCERRLRLRTRPGTRNVTCPACDTRFEMTG